MGCNRTWRTNRYVQWTVETTGEKLSPALSLMHLSCNRQGHFRIVALGDRASQKQGKYVANSCICRIYWNRALFKTQGFVERVRDTSLDEVRMRGESGTTIENRSQLQRDFGGGPMKLGISDSTIAGGFPQKTLTLLPVQIHTKFVPDDFPPQFDRRSPAPALFPVPRA